MRSRLRRLLLGLLVLALLLLPLLSPLELASCVYVQEVTTTSATLCRQVFGRTTDEVVVLAADQREVARQPLAGERNLRAVVAGLTPGQRYRWERRAVGQDAVLDAGSFTTALDDDRAPLRFALLGDSGGQPRWTQLRRSALVHLLGSAGWLWPNEPGARIAAAMAAAEPQFFVHLGDIIYPSAIRGSWAAGFFHPLAPLLRTSPCYPVFGNHDIMGDTGQRVQETFVMPGIRDGVSRQYSLVRGPVRLVMLDSNGGFGAEKVAFLRAQLAIATEPWLLVAAHHPIRSISHAGDDERLQNHLLPELQRAQADAYFAGHDHNYQRCRLGSVWHIVSGGGGKDLYDLQPAADTLAAAEAFHWCRVDVDGARLRLQAIGIDGAVLDTLELAHDADSVARIRAFSPQRADRIAALLASR